jgi:hypothetical protein
MRAEPSASGGASIPAPQETAPDGPRSRLLPAHPSTPTERSTRADRRGAGAVFVAVGALPGAVGFNLLLDAHTGDLSGHGAAGWYTLAFGTLSAAAAGFALRGHLTDRSPLPAVGVITAAVLVLALGNALLLHLAPFRFGLLSLALYPAPTTALIAGLRPRRTTSLLTGAAVALLLPAAAGLPVGLLQRHVAADQWVHAQAIPDRALLQVVDFPSLRRQPYLFDPGSGQLTMLFGIPGALTDTIWTAAETVTEGENPCGPVTTAQGDATNQGTPLDCEPLGNGLWRLALPSEQTGYARVTGHVTIAVTGVSATDAQRALLAAHQADDEDLWTRIDPGPVSLLDLLLL